MIHDVRRSCSLGAAELNNAPFRLDLASMNRIARYGIVKVTMELELIMISLRSHQSLHLATLISNITAGLYKTGGETMLVSISEGFPSPGSNPCGLIRLRFPQHYA